MNFSNFNKRSLKVIHELTETSKKHNKLGETRDQTFQYNTKHSMRDKFIVHS